MRPIDIIPILVSGILIFLTFRFVRWRAKHNGEEHEKDLALEVRYKEIAKKLGLSDYRPGSLRHNEIEYWENLVKHVHGEPV